MAHEDLAARVAQALPSLRHFGHQPESAAWGSRLVEDIGILLAAYDAQAARLAAQQPVMDAVLKLSTYSRETVDAGVQRIVETLGDYEEWLLGAGAPGESP